MNHQDVQATLIRVFDKIRRMSDSEFIRAVESHRDGDVAQILRETRFVHGMLEEGASYEGDGFVPLAIDMTELMSKFYHIKGHLANDSRYGMSVFLQSWIPAPKDPSNQETGGVGSEWLTVAV